MRVEIPVKGGKLTLTDVGGRLAFEYQGFVPYDWAHELVANTPTDWPSMTINSQPLLKWIEGLNKNALHNPAG